MSNVFLEKFYVICKRDGLFVIIGKKSEQRGTDVER